ncbi:MAG: membrane protein insertase YidC, partial [Thermoanaerobaculia bacterium]
MDNKRLLIAAVLSMAVLFLWQMAFPAPEAPKVAVPALAATQGAAGSPAANAAAAATAAIASGGLNGPGTASGAVVPAAAVEALPPVAASEEHHEVLENEALRAEFTNLGARLVSLRVKDTNAAGAAKGAGVELVSPRKDSPLPFSLVAPNGEALPANAALFVAERETGKEGEALRFLFRDGRGEVEKRFVLGGDGRLEISITAASEKNFSVLLGPGLRERTAAELGSRFDRRMAVWSAAAKVETLDPAKARDPLEIAGTGLDWIGLEDTYFLTAVVPHEPVAKVRLRPVMLVQSGDEHTFDTKFLPPSPEEIAAADKKLPRDLILEIEPRSGTFKATSYWGTKQLDRLLAMPYGFDKTVRLGTFGFLAKPLLKALQWIHSHVVANYGWAIVLLTMALKIVLLPLSL